MSYDFSKLIMLQTLKAIYRLKLKNLERKYAFANQDFKPYKMVPHSSMLQTFFLPRAFLHIYFNLEIYDGHGNSFKIIFLNFVLIIALTWTNQLGEWYSNNFTNY